MRARALLACLLVVAPGSAAFAQSDSYEANSGLLPLGGFVVFFDAGGPLSYLTMTPRDLPPGSTPIGVVTGRGCQYGVSTPLVGLSGLPRLSGGGGEGGFEKALQDIREHHPELKGIYDVKVDDHVVGVLTVFQRQCTEVTAVGFR